jgi:hypothetical protein
MSPPLFTQLPRPLAATAVSSTPQSGGRRANAYGTQAAARPPAPPAPDAATAQQQPDSVSLSSQALASRAASDAGSAAMDIARDAVKQFARQLFGDAGKGAKLTLDSATLDTAASFAASGSYTSGADGTSATANLSLTQSAHFIGTGQITTKDGHTYDVEIEVTYEANLTASASQQTQVDAPDVALAGKPLPAISYPGSLSDLFKVLGRELSTEEGDDGRLTMRLLRLVDRAALLAPRLPADEPAAQAVRQMGAKAYASAPPSALLADD